MREVQMTPFRLMSPLLAAVLLLAMAACSGSPSTGAAATDAGGAGAPAGPGIAPVQLDPAAMHAAGIVVQTLQPASMREPLRAPGEVLDIAYGTALITPSVGALVVRRHARLGDQVRTGAPLVTLSSVEVANAQAELRIAAQEWRRVSALGREAVSGRRINEAKVALDRARATAQAYGLPGTAAGHSNGQFTLTAPHAGRITEDAVVVGEKIEAGKTLFRLVDESVVWVDANLPSGIVPRITPGTEATVVFNGERLAGTVQRPAHRTSDSTRNAVVRIEVPNKHDRIHSGDYVDVFFDASEVAKAGDAAATTVSVPTDALVQLEGDTVVFRRNAAGALEPVPVRTGEVIGDRTVIREGLKPGDAVVVQGAFSVKARMLKSQLGEE